MYEMLGNHYFMIRDYARAAEMLFRALRKDPKSKPMRRKLVICLTQIGQVRRALEVFLSLIKEDISFIINTDPVADDCPCPDLVFDMEQRWKKDQASLDHSLTLGMLYLYCDVGKSLEYFLRAVQLNPDDPMIKSAVTFIRLRAEKDTGAVPS